MKNQKVLTAQEELLMIEKPMIEMVKDARELTKELNVKVRKIRQAIAEDDEALRKETNRIFELNKKRMDEIFKLDEEYDMKRRQAFNNR